MRGEHREKAFSCSFCKDKGDLGTEIIHIETINTLDIYICVACYKDMYGE